jgi:hypothetical protein
MSNDKPKKKATALAYSNHTTILVAIAIGPASPHYMRDFGVEDEFERWRRGPPHGLFS